MIQSKINRKLRVYYQNVRGLKTKTSVFRSQLLLQSYDVIVLCETWLREDVFTSELFDDRYVVYRNDRNNESAGKKDGGGCLIAVNKKLFSKRVSRFELQSDLWVSIEHVDDSKTYFNVKYIELGTVLDEYRKHFEKTVENMLSSNVNDSFVMCGDYNLGGSITWCHDPLSSNYYASDVNGSIPNELLDMLSLCDLNQLNVVRNGVVRTLDLCITSLQPDHVSITRSNSPLVPEDGHHPALDMCVDLSRCKFLVERRPPKVNFFKADYDHLNKGLMEVDWRNELLHLDVDDAVDRFYGLLQPFIETVPKTFVHAGDYPVFYSNDLISLIKRKERVRLSIKGEDCPLARARLELDFVELRKAVKAGIKVCFDDYVKNCEEKIKSNSKCFFAFTKSLRKTNTLPNCMTYLDEEASSRSSICNLFATYFNSVYNPTVDTASEVAYDPFAHQSVTNSEDMDVIFTPEQVEATLKGFDVNKASSPDDIPMMFFMRLSLSLSLPLCILFNKSMKESKFPSRWKIGFVSPVFKEGDKNCVANYRPVTILCAMSKVFERLVFNKLFDDVKSDVHHSQHGFFAKRSTQTNLMEYVSDVADAIAGGGQVDTIYTDFAKAFDKVDHGILLDKLRSHGFSGKIVQWFSTYLRDRSQFVIIGASKSDRINPTSGVPQGSILGPLLFILFINDLLASLSSCSAFADDLKVYKSVSDEYDCLLLQDDIIKIVDWCRVNNMHLNVDKCAVMSTSYSPNKILFQYNIGNDVLKRVDKKKDLGVIIDDRLSFVEHVSDITRKSYRMLGFLFRCGRYFSSQLSMRLLFSSLVLSRLEYCSTVWNPLYANHSDQIERVQKKFTRLFYYKFQIAHPRPEYHVRLKHLKMHSLESRRLENDEIMLYKIVHNLVDTPLCQKLSFHNPTRQTRRKSTFCLPMMTTNYQRNAPLNRIQLNHDIYFGDLNVVGSTLCAYKELVRSFFDW